jgi:F-type H+-transporting ATPase subunit a
MDPIHQFQIVNLFSLGKLGSAEIAVVGLTLFLVIGTAGGRAVPTRLQSAAELSYEFVASMVRSTAGSEGMKFFPFVFTIFMFVLTLNLFGLIPYGFTVTSHIIITAALALMVFFTVLGYGLMRHGLHFFNLFVPKGVPIYILPMIVAIEILSFISRPISHSVRLFANMLAGHIALKVFAGFIILLGGALGAIGWAGGVLPFGMIVALTALELLVAFLQAYVFAVLTCIYLNDAIHPGH